MKIKNSPSGMTLIEVLTAVSIIILLANIITASVFKAKIRARDAVRISDIQAVENALALYYGDNSSYPTTFNESGSMVWYGACADANETNCTHHWGVNKSGNDWVPEIVAKGYMAKLPADPFSNNCGRCYLYMSNGSDYKILAHLPENINAKDLESFIDPARNGKPNNPCPCQVPPCSSSKPWSWSVYSSGPGVNCW